MDQLHIGSLVYTLLKNANFEVLGLPCHHLIYGRILILCKLDYEIILNE